MELTPITSLRAYLLRNRHVFNLSKISVLEFGSHSNLLSNFVNKRGLGLGEKEQTVLQFFKSVGFKEE
jgi:hypothetical protein